MFVQYLEYTTFKYGDFAVMINKIYLLFLKILITRRLRQTINVKSRTEHKLNAITRLGMILTDSLISNLQFFVDSSETTNLNI